jgi:two-component system OmpR family response regulator
MRKACSLLGLQAFFSGPLQFVTPGCNGPRQAIHVMTMLPKAGLNERPHILVVDDDTDIRTLLSEYLEAQGYRATAVPDARAMRRLLEQSSVDLIVLDLMLPGENGIAICRDLRARSQVPIIMLTALGEEIDRIVGLEVGADDYLPKPFNPRELLGRIKAVLRRAVPVVPEADLSRVASYRFGDWRLHMLSRTLTDTNGAKVPLGGADFRLLSLLLAHGNRVVSRAQLMELMHGRELDPFDRSIDVGISRLRQTLRDEARSPAIIKTVYGEGYVMGVKVDQE